MDEYVNTKEVEEIVNMDQRNARIVYERILCIDREIRNNNYPNLNDLVEICPGERSRKTIQRDIEHMTTFLGAPIQYDTKKKGYIYTEPNYFLPAFMLTQSDLFGLTIAEQVLRQYKNTPLYENLDKIFTKLARYVGDDITPIAPEVFEKNFTLIHDPATTLKTDVWEQIIKCIHYSRRACIDYQKLGSSSIVKRKFDPYHLIARHGCWYVFGWDHKRSDMRMFALHRIHKVEVLEDVFAIPKDFSISEYIDKELGVFVNPQEYDVEIQCDSEIAPYIKERNYHKTQKIIENSDNTLLLKFRTNQLMFAQHLILSMGKHAKAIAPERLVEMVKEQAKGAASLYD
ncbi:MAG: helix-turn-helix transcriptional regulator [Spirochaetia bacterium]